MAIGVGGVDFVLQPTSSRWLVPSPLGYSGDGHPQYPAIFSHELRWQLGSPSDLHDVQAQVSGSLLGGYVTMTLPEFGSNQYVYKNYSGCTLNYPDYGAYFTQHITEFVLIINNVRI